MDFVVNDIVWWKISLLNLMNSWAPTILFGFILVIGYSTLDKIRRDLSDLKRSLLVIFGSEIVGEKVSLEKANSVLKSMKLNLAVFNSTYPNLLLTSDADFQKALDKCTANAINSSDISFNPQPMIDYISALKTRNYLVFSVATLRSKIGVAVKKVQMTKK